APRLSVVVLLSAGIGLGALALSGLSVASADPAAGQAEAHALYLAQRYAHAGDLKTAAVHARRSGTVVPTCTVVVVLKVRGARIPLCESSAVTPPEAVARRVNELVQRAAAGGTQAHKAAQLLDEARRLDPFDARITPPLARALRAL